MLVGHGVMVRAGMVLWRRRQRGRPSEQVDPRQEGRGGRQGARSGRAQGGGRGLDHLHGREAGVAGARGRRVPLGLLVS